MFNNQQPPHTTLSSSELDTTTTTNDGASIELVRKPRGRPRGSKNKRKPVYVTKEPESSNTMFPYVLEVASGSDIIGVVTRFCDKRNTGICVLSGSGSVSNVSFRQPTMTGPVTFHGVVELLSMSTTVFPSSSPPQAMLTPLINKDFGTEFTITIAGPKGLTYGGAIVGLLIAAGTVYIGAASFNNPLYHRLPLKEDDQVQNSGGGYISTTREQPTSSSGGDSGRPYAPTPTSTTTELLSMHSSHLSTEGIWAPIPRQPPIHPSFY